MRKKSRCQLNGTIDKGCMHHMDMRIIADLRETYQLQPENVTPVSGGWLNAKWRMMTSQGEVLIKQFSPTRYSKKKIDQLECALQRQIALESLGFPCPHIWQVQNRGIRMLGDDLWYMVMEYIPGEIMSPETISLAQMRHLGEVCALMHKCFASFSPSGLDEIITVSSLWENYDHHNIKAKSLDIPAYQRAVSLQQPILEWLRDDFFAPLPRGITHSDFSADNMLFHADGVAAVLDFDRNRYGYLWQDIGRALLSLSLLHGSMDKSKVELFVEGYNTYLPFTMPDAMRSLRLSWCIEVGWWVTPQLFLEAHPKVARFRDEMVWMTENWFALDELI